MATKLRDSPGFRAPVANSRVEKEAFVSDLSGTTHWEVINVILLVPLLTLTGSWLSRRLGYRSSLVCEFTTIILPAVAAFTQVLSPTFWLATALCAYVAIFLHSFSRMGEEQALRVLQSFAHSRRKYLDVVRGAILLVTCLGILGIDFRIYPRRFGKAELYGKSPMDLGSGGFAFMSGLVAKTSKDRMAFSWTDYRRRLVAGTRTSLLLVVIGAARLVSVSATDYQVHVGEYGVHWNFFFTLASVFFLSSLIPLNGNLLIIGAILSLVLHQVALTFGGLTKYMHAYERGTSLIELNKEGIFSLPGYWSLYLWGSLIGQSLLSCARTVLGRVEFNGNKPSKAKKALAAWIGIVSSSATMIYILCLFCEEYIDEVSRRSCNMAYIVWQIGITLFATLLSAMSEACGCVPELLCIMNRNLLQVFLFANLATGFVNFTMNTLEAEDMPARAVLCTYMACVCAFGILLDKSNQNTTLKDK